MAQSTYDNVYVFRNPRVIGLYSRKTGLEIPEQEVLKRFQGELHGKRILDIGVGAGSYVGIDISPEMIDHCRREFPTGNFAVCTAADLSRFAECKFDMVLFSFNGLDYLGHEARLMALGEIRRTLAPGGLFVFSTHNRACRPMPPWNVRGMNLDALRRPIRTLKTLASFPLSVINHLHMRGFESHHEEYSMLNDNAHFYSLITYYISIADQVRQLKESGFDSIEPVSLIGRWLQPQEWDQAVDNPWIYYVCRKQVKSNST